MSKSLKRNEAWYVIVNPAAGKGSMRKAWPKLEKLLRRYISPLEFVFTQYPQHAITLAQKAVENGFYTILAAGGDGTNHEVINGLMRQDACPSAQINYGLIPIGTGNDWARTYQIPRDTEKWLWQLKEKKTVLQDVGKANYYLDGEKQSRFFTNVAGLAYDAYIAHYLELYPQKTSSRFQYLLAVFERLLKYKLQKARIEFNDQVIEKYCYTINAGICAYSGGGMRLVPHARPNDGLLALTVAGALSKLGVLLNTPRFYNGQLGRHPKVDLFQTREIQIDSLDDLPIPLEADGEFLGYTPVKIEIIPRALKVIVPLEMKE